MFLQSVFEICEEGVDERAAESQVEELGYCSSDTETGDCVVDPDEVYVECFG